MIDLIVLWSTAKELIEQAIRAPIQEILTNVGAIRTVSAGYSGRRNGPDKICQSLFHVALGLDALSKLINYRFVERLIQRAELVK